MRKPLAQPNPIQLEWGARCEDIVLRDGQRDEGVFTCSRRIQLLDCPE